MKRLLASISWAIYLWATKPPAKYEVYLHAVQDACVDAGLNRQAAIRDFDLVKTGKLHEVLTHASRRLQLDLPLVTVGDVTQYLLRLRE